MKKRLKRIDPLKAGIVLGILYALLSLILVPIFLLVGFFGARNAGGNGVAILGSAAMVIFLPVFYSVAGFLGGVIGAFFYNLVAGWTGGLEFEVEDVV